MLEEFKKFALRGNVVDLAIGVIIGAAFTASCNSLVGDIIMPLIGAITGGLDFSNYFLPLSSKVTADTLAEAKKQGAVLAWGSFLTVTLNFIIIAWVLFLVIRGINRLAYTKGSRRRAAAADQAEAAAHRNPRPAQSALNELNRPIPWLQNPSAASRSSPTIARRASTTRSAKPSRPASRSPAAR